MQDTIFTVELPLVETNEELEKIKGLYPRYDSYFIASGCCKERREKFDKLWIKYKPYTDKHFLNQIQTNFHQRSWEMYIGNVLLEKGLIMQSKNEGPDFVIDKTAYVECVAPTKGDPAKPDSVPEMFVATTPEEIRIPDVLKALFGFQFMQINIKTGATNFSHRDKVEKSNKEPVPVNYFVNKDFSFVSGVIFSDKTVLNHPEKIGEDCVFVNNPFADNPVDGSFVRLFKNWTASKENDKISLKKEKKI